MADVRGAWNETGEKLTDLGRKLKVHYDTQHGENQQTRDELADAARRLGAAVQDAFEAIGAAARDKTVQDDVKKVGHSLVEALGATVGTAADELRRAFSERKGSAVSTPTAPSAGPADAGAPAGEPLTTEPPAAPSPEASAGASPGQTSGGTADGEGGEQPPKVEPWGTP